MHVRERVRQVAGFMVRRRRIAWVEFGVRYTPECAYCGVPDETAVRYPHAVSVCRECHVIENEDCI